MDRRSLVAVVAGLLAVRPWRARAAEKRRAAPIDAQSVFDYGWTYTHRAPAGVFCRRGTSRRSGDVVTLTLPCRGTGKPRGFVRMRADVTATESGEDIGWCAAQKKAKRGRFKVSCRVSFAKSDPLPISLSGTGSGLSDVVRLPGGRLLATLTITGAAAGEYNHVGISYSGGSSSGILYGNGNTDGRTEIFTVYATDSARITVQTTGSWTLALSEAFPAQP